MSPALRRELDALRRFLVGVSLDSDADAVKYAREQLRDLVRAEDRHLKAISRAAKILQGADR